MPVGKCQGGGRATQRSVVARFGNSLTRIVYQNDVVRFCRRTLTLMFLGLIKEAGELRLPIQSLAFQNGRDFNAKLQSNAMTNVLWVYWSLELTY